MALWVKEYGTRACNGWNTGYNVSNGMDPLPIPVIDTLPLWQIRRRNRVGASMPRCSGFVGCRALGLGYQTLKIRACPSEPTSKVASHSRFIEVAGFASPNVVAAGEVIVAAMSTDGARLTGTIEGFEPVSADRDSCVARTVVIQIKPQMCGLVAIEPVDFRRGIDGLGQVCRAVLSEDRMDGTMPVFRSRAA